MSSVVLLAVACGLLFRLHGGRSARSTPDELLVYCAIGMKPAVEPAAKLFEAKHGMPIRLNHGPSGGLEAQIQLSERGDLFIPAAKDPYLTRGMRDGSVVELTPLVQMHLVLAFNTECDANVASVRELVESGVPFAIANPQAAVGLRTKESLQTAGIWQQVESAAKAALPTVNETAEAIRLGIGVQAGIVWDATARQYRLRVVEAPELREGRSVVSVGLLASSKSPRAAMQFAGFLASADGGQRFFQRERYEAIVDAAP